MKKIVITGQGVVSGYGLKTKDFWQGLISGVSAIKALNRNDDVRMNQAALLPDYKEEEYFDAKDLPILDRVSQLAILAARQAIQDANLTTSNTAVSTIIGSGGGGKHTDELGYYRLYKEKKTRVHPMMIPRGMHSAIASNVSKDLQLKGPAFTLSSACASGAHALIVGANFIREGLIDIAVVGGTEAPFPYGMMKAWDAMRIVTNDACRAFSEDRSGIILGEGAGILVIESEESAKRRGAKIYAEINGYGMSSDAGHITKPDPIGIETAIKNALSNANVDYNEIDYINAHGTATILNDKIESEIINKVFKERADEILVASSKALHGHCLGASSAMEIISTVLTLNNNIIPPTLNYRVKDKACDLNLVINKAKQIEVQTALSNAFAFGGLNASVILSTYHD